MRGHRENGFGGSETGSSVISTFTVVFDANVLFGSRLRSLLMELAMSGLFRPRWTEDIHEEWIRAVVEARPSLTSVDLEPTRQSMDSAVPDSLVTGYQGLIDALDLPDPGDRHVLAAAIRCGASLIVTFNLRDFPAEALAPFGIAAKHPDDFIIEADDLDPGVLIDAVRTDLAHYQRPPLTIDAYIDGLRRTGVPKTVSRIEALRILLADQ
jgi:hypothetical protein